MKRNREKLLSIVVLAGMLVLMSACGGSKEDKKEAGAEQTNTTQISAVQAEGVQAENTTSVSGQEDSGSVTAGQGQTDSAEAQEAGSGETAAGSNATGESQKKPAGAPPVVTENPTDETLTEGYSCMYIATADNADRMEWRAVSPDGKTDISYAELETYFPYMEYVGENEEAVSLYNVSLEFDGWGSYCRFTNSAGSVDSNHAVTHVKPIQAEETEQTAGQGTQEQAAQGQSEQQPVQAEAVG